jgi:hypothetical protein
MAREGLKRPAIDSTGRQGLAINMPQHVRKDREWQLSGFAKPFYELVGGVEVQKEEATN